MSTKWYSGDSRTLEDLLSCQERIKAQYKLMLEKKEILYKQAISSFLGYEATVENSDLWSKKLYTIISDSCGTEDLFVDGIKVLAIKIKGLDLYYEFTY